MNFKILGRFIYTLVQVSDLYQIHRKQSQTTIPPKVQVTHLHHQKKQSMTNVMFQLLVFALLC